MARFNLADYATVDERLALLYAEHPDARIVTINLTTPQDRAAKTWVVKSELWLVDDAGVPYLKATGHAFEIDGQAGANVTSALENCETSSVGRCLALAGYSGNRKGLASREEMEKVERGVTPVGRDWLVESEALALAYNLDGLRQLYVDARAAGVSEEVLGKIQGWADVAGKS